MRYVCNTYLKWRFLNLNCVSMIPVVFTRVRSTSCGVELKQKIQMKFTNSNCNFYIFPLFLRNDLLGWAIIGGGDSVKCVEVILGAVVQLILP